MNRHEANILLAGGLIGAALQAIVILLMENL